jgi:hypothetical protein
MLAVALKDKKNNPVISSTVSGCVNEIVIKPYQKSIGKST